MDSLALPSSSNVKSIWQSPEGWTAAGVLLFIIAVVFRFGEPILSFILSMLIDTLHMVYLSGLLAAILYLVFSKRMRLVYRVILRKITSLFVAVYPIEIIEDKLAQMKKRRDKMNDQIGLVKGSIVRLQRVMSQNEADAQKGFGQALQAQKMAANAKDQGEQQRMQLESTISSRKAKRRQDSNIGYSKLLERLQKVYSFLSRYSLNIDFFIEDTEDEINSKKIEFETTKTAFGAMKQAMAVIRGNATEEDIYGQAFEYIENSVSTQLGIMDDLQRISQNFMDGVDVQTGAVDEAALQALNAFEQKTLTAGNSAMQMVTVDRQSKSVPAMNYPVTNSSYEDLLK